MLLVSLIILWWVGVGFTVGLVTTEDTPFIGYTAIFLGWPIVLGEYIKHRVEGIPICS